MVKGRGFLGRHSGMKRCDVIFDKLLWPELRDESGSSSAISITRRFKWNLIFFLSLSMRFLLSLLLDLLQTPDSYGINLIGDSQNKHGSPSI